MISTANALSYIILKNRVVNMYAYIRRQDYESVKG